MKYFIVMIAVFWAGVGQIFASPPTATLIEVKKIWGQAPHSAFTDLVRWNDQFVCAFREGRGHVSSDGKIRVLTSTNGNNWKPSALVEITGYDLRDAGLSEAPDGRLMLIGGAAPRPNDGEDAHTGTFVSFSDDARTWTKPKIVLSPGRWLWRVTWTSASSTRLSSSKSVEPHGGKAYGVSYATPAGHPFTALLTSDDGTDFRQLVPKLFGEGYPTEAVIRIGKNGLMYCLQRRDGMPPHNSAYLGITASPYTDWQWHDLKLYLGGPNFIQIPSGQWIAAGRILHGNEPKTEIAWLDVEKKKLQPILQLLSSGDTSYPGLVWHDDMLWVSYYSSHEGKANIYMAKVKIE